MDLFKQLLHKRYQAVDPGQDESVFGQEEDDGSDELSIEKLSRLHNVLLSQESFSMLSSSLPSSSSWPKTLSSWPGSTAWYLL